MATKTSRIELRAQPEAADKLSAAARLADQSMTSFVLAAALARADEVIEAAATTVVPPDFYDRMLAALDEPAVPNDALTRAAKRLQKRVAQR
jgi:uncharacterized protein (DUF1778 family)